MRAEMIFALLLGLGVAFVVWLLTAQRIQAHDQRYVYVAEIVSVYDGDTATVDIDVGFDVWLRDQDLRFYCVNTPEIRGSERNEGIPVRDTVREWLPVGSTVTLETVQDRTGKFGRWLALITPEGWDETVNARLLREGLAEIEAYSPTQVAACNERLGILQ